MTAVPILTTHGLTKDFHVAPDGLRGKPRRLRAVDGVDLTVHAGETLGIVGESGCGKSTLGRVILRLMDPTEGRVLFDGRDLTMLSSRRMKEVRQDMQIVFQDPYSSLNPRMKVRDIIAEPMENRPGSRAEIDARVREVMETVGLTPDSADRYPHEFSGGQRQRIGIARALAPRPRLVICDEAVSALDVSVQAQILNLLRRVQEETGVAFLFISHNLGVVRFISHRVAVMYLGRIVEIASESDLFDTPRHPYTRALIDAIPEVGRREPRRPLPGDLPSPIDPPPGCPFHGRCPTARPRCAHDVPVLAELTGGHSAACHYPIPYGGPADAG